MMQNNSALLSRAECGMLRGLAILGIFLHNYCHWLGRIVKENEYQWFQRNVDGFDRALAAPDAYLPLHVLSYLGHYGVPIFLFLSAYGLERKYAQMPFSQGESRLNGAGTFLWSHFRKLFKMMIVGYALFTLVDFVTPGRARYDVTQILSQLTMTVNFLWEPNRHIWPGPFWYFGLMMQAYIVYRLLLFRRHWGWTVGLVVACLGAQMLFAPESEGLNYFRYNLTGGMLPFGAGLLFARFAERLPQMPEKPGAWLVSALVSTAAIIALCHSYLGWCVAPLMVCAAAISWVKFAAHWDVSAKCLSWTGAVSAALFITHPVARKVFIPLSRNGDIYAGLLLYIIGALTLAWIVDKLLKR